MIQFIKNQAIYEQVIKKVPEAKKFVWIGTANIKDLHVEKAGKRRFVPFLEILSDLIKEGISIRLLYGKEPGPRFREEIEKYPNLNDIEFFPCPRVHLKTVIIDGKFSYIGSANLTGAGMGAKSEKNRNFENGIITNDPKMVAQIMNQFDEIWMESRCDDCGRKEFCGGE